MQKSIVQHLLTSGSHYSNMILDCKQIILEGPFSFKTFCFLNFEFLLIYGDIDKKMNVTSM